MDNLVYSKSVVEFVTVGNEYCTNIEELSGLKKEDFLLRMDLLLPLLYLKSSLLPSFDYLCDEPVETFVDEAYYYSTLNIIQEILQESDSYLVYRKEESQLSEDPQIASIAEDIMDIYQSLKNATMSYQLGTMEVMNDALLECKNLFQEYWGVRLLNALKAIHQVRFHEENDSEIYNK